MFISSIFKHVTPSKATLLLTSLYLLARTGRLRIPQSLKLFIGFLFMLNWQNWPLYWHFRVFVFPVLQVKKDQLLAFLGILSEKTRRLKQLQLPAKEWQHAAIGLSPFAAVSYTSSKASWARSDAFGMHFSNSNYLQEMDLARFAYYSRYLQGPAQDGLLLAVGGTSNVYFSPIGLHQSFSVETRLAAYNDRWLFVLHIFTLPVTKSPGKSIVIQTPKGPRVLCALALSKGICKLKGARETVHPGRVISAAGCGVDVGNWHRIQALRKEGKAKEWIASNKGSDGLEPFQEHNQRALEVISRLGGGEIKSVWMELLQVAHAA